MYDQQQPRGLPPQSRGQKAPYKLGHAIAGNVQQTLLLIGMLDKIQKALKPYTETIANNPANELFETMVKITFSKLEMHYLRTHYNDKDRLWEGNHSQLKAIGELIETFV